MQLRQTVIAALLAISSIGAANAAITNNDAAGGGELYLVANKVNSGTSYTYTFDTGLSFASFLPSAASALSNQSFSLSGDSNWTSFLSQAGGATGVKWAVYAGNNADSGTAGGQQIMMTTNRVSTGMVGSTTANRLTDTRMNTGLQNTATFLNATNQAGTHATLANGSSLNVGNGSADYATGKQNLFGAAYTATFAPASTIDTEARFALVENSLSTTSTVTNYSTAGAAIADMTDPGVATWLLSSDGTLSYTAAVAAVPEPGEWAFMMAGFGLVGLIARRRARA
jgi:hypothetical protein